MIRWLIVLTEIVILVMVFKSSFAQYLLSDVHKTVSGWIEHIATIPEQTELASIQEQMAPQVNTMRPFQQNYLNEVMSSKEGLVHFHRLYCVKNDKNPFIRDASLRYFCQTIENSRILSMG